MSEHTLERQRLARHLVADEQVSLEDLAAKANREHMACDAVLRSRVIPHAIAAGEALMTARDRVGHGNWIQWVTDNFDGGLSTARRYMRIAEHRDRLTTEMTVHDAIRALAGLETSGLKPHGVYAPEVRERALAMVRDGSSVRGAAEAVGVAFGTMQRWANPKATKRQRAAAAQRRRRERAAAEQLERQRKVARAVRKAGAALSEAYAMAERMQDVLAQAEAETDGAARAALDRAGTHYRKMRDEIVHALFCNDGETS